MFLAGFGDHAPTHSTVAVRDELVAAIDASLERLKTLFENDLAAFNKEAAEAGLQAVRVATNLDR